MITFKIIVSVIIVLCFVYIGKEFASKYLQRVKFYSELMRLNELFINDILYKKNGIVAVLKSNSFEVNFKIFTDYVLNELKKQNTDLLENILKFLSEDEITELNNYMQIIGKSTSSVEIDNYKSMLEKSKLKLKKCEEEKSKAYNLIVKLSICFGLLFVILFF